MDQIQHLPSLSDSPALGPNARIDPDGVVTLYQYNAKGEVLYTAVDMNQNDVIDLVGPDRVTQIVTDVTTDNGINVRRTQTYVYPTDSSSNAVLVGKSETATDGLSTWQTQYRDANTPVTLSTQTLYGPAAGARTLVTRAADNSYTVSVYSYSRLSSVTHYNSTDLPIGSSTYSYDPHGHQYTVTDARNGVTTYTHNAADLVASVTTPNPGTPGATAQTTVNFYNLMLQNTNIVYPDNTGVTNSYLLTGEVGTNWGARTYPVAYTYDYAGRMKTMVTWKNFTANSGAATTTWAYDPYRGFLKSKTYDSGAAGPSYSYTPAGRVQTRTWARNITTTYTYDNGGSPYTVVYSDGTTPNVTYTNDRLGRQSAIACNGVTTTFSYNTANEVLSESYAGGTLAGQAVTNGYDTFLRRIALGISTQPSALTIYGYDNASRLSSVANGGNSISYIYLANSPLVGQLEFNNNNALRVRTTKAYDNLNRLSSISAANAQGAVLDSHAYAYNNANQRTGMTNSEASFWVYQYDSLGQVTSGVKCWSDGTPVAGEQFGYTFDTIGNRQSTTAGGDQNGANLRSATYSPNNLNQYASRTVPNAVDVLGSATNAATVTVNGQSTYRKNDYYRLQLGIDNSTGPVFQSVTNSALFSQGTTAYTTNVTGSIFLPQSVENFTYDLDGNLSTDGRWTYTWDAENRLSTLVARTSAGPQQSIKFEYDSQGRRIGKKVWNNLTFNGTPTVELKFLYDGWNIMAILNSSFGLQTAFIWGLDLSRSMQGAGGVGGLLEISDTVNGAHFAAFDGNGNLTGLAKAVDGSVSAQYEYGPFGELLRATGPMAKANPFRFSAKYQDDETDLLYYGYRYYNPTTGRWLSRDPIGEDGGENLYGFAANAPSDDWDWLGLCGCTCKSVLVTFLPGGKSPKVDFYPQQDPFGTTYRYGFVVRIEWTVDGPANDCKYFLNEPAGGVTGETPKGSVDPSAGTGGWISVPQVTLDALGIPVNRGEGKYKIKVDLMQQYKCRSSDGTEVTDSKQITAHGSKKWKGPPKGK